jgi:hypothetical protein
MKTLLGWVLLFLSGLVMVSMIINNHILWFIVDILVILGCGVSGLFLLIRRQ